MQTVLICGAGIAGPTLAYWLRGAGFLPVIVERAPAPRPGGQAIDIRGAAIDVIERMGLLPAVRELRTRLQGFSAVDGDGNELWRSEGMTLTGGALDNTDIEILRDDLSRILVDTVACDTEIVFGDDIVALDEDAAGIIVRFESGCSRRFDLVVGADGIGSQVRSLVFGDESQFLHPLDFALAIYSAPNHIGLQEWQVSCRDGVKYCIAYAVRESSELRLCFGFPATMEDARQFDLNAQKALVARKAEGMGWEVPRLLEAMWAAPDFYLGIVAQVKMSAWTKGRVTLVGDAACCPSPFTGQGTSLALVGAYVLAQELARTPSDHAGAFARYEARMRPFVDRNQAIAALCQHENFAEEGGQARIFAAVEAAKNAIKLDE